MIAVASSPLAAGAESVAPSARIRLNTFQLLMRRWARIHPYNAGQLMEVTGTPDRQRWLGAIAETLRETGIGCPFFTPDDQEARFSAAGSTTLPLGIAAGESGVSLEFQQTTLPALFNAELNRPFAPQDCPIRFFMLPVAGEEGRESHYLVAVYDHWIADSRAMRELMRRIFHRYRHASDDVAPLPPLKMVSPSFSSLFRKGGTSLGVMFRQSVKKMWHHRRAYRINLINPADFDSRLLMHRFPDGLIAPVRAFAKKYGASVNDVLIAALAQTMDDFTLPHRNKKRKKKLHFPRDRMGIGTIVDIRYASKKPLDDVFNLYLSSFTVILSHPREKALAEVLQQVSRHTTRIKTSGDAVRGFWALPMLRFWWDFYREPRHQAQMLHKMVPVVAGISNVNMTDSWADPSSKEHAEEAVGHGEPRVLDYVRVSPTGPLLPVVFTLTTVGARVNLCVTYRTTAFSEGDVQVILGAFLKRLEGL